MVFERDEMRIQAQIEIALADEEIQGGLLRASLAPEEVLAQADAKKDEIWGAATDEISDFERLTESKKQEEERIWRQFQRTEKDKPWLGKWFAATMRISVTVLTLSSLYIALELIRAPEGRASPMGLLDLRSIAYVAILAIAIGSIGNALWLSLRVRARRNASSGREFAIYRKEMGMDAFDEKLAVADQAIDKALREKGAKPVFREIINRVLAHLYDMRLPKVDPRGLSEVFEPSYEIATPAREKLRDMLDSMQGGSIGLAGPRGAGKTTLIRSVCKRGAAAPEREAGSEAEPELAKKPILPVMLAAPTDYDARDFLLHLFSSVCHAILDLEIGNSRKIIDNDVRRAANNNAEKQIINRYHDSFSLIFILGLLISLIGSGILWIDMFPGMAGDTALALSERWNSIDLKPLQILAFGTLLALAGHIGKRVNRTSPGNAEDYIEPNLSDKPLAEAALDQLRDIKFQQSHTSGWSGTLKLPGGIGASIRQAHSIARHPLSVPEIVEKYQLFVREISEHYSPVIAIDELDKMSSDEVAQRFLNEIKVIFAQKKVFYLVSVSESAMSNFERRGLPFRDVFDSSFDDIIYVDYLDVDSAKRLLMRRVIGMPIPFLCLCHCLSGGLARDLIRACRNLTAANTTDHERANLQSVCRELIGLDLKAKVRAVAIATRRLTLTPTVNDFMRRVFELEERNLEIDHLIEMAQTLFVEDGPSQPNDPGQGSSPRVGDAAWRQVYRLRTELGAFLLYCATMLRFFDRDLTQEKLERAESDGTLDRITQYRQLLAVNPQEARARMIADLEGREEDTSPDDTPPDITPPASMPRAKRRANDYAAAAEPIVAGFPQQRGQSAEAGE